MRSGDLCVLELWCASVGGQLNIGAAIKAHAASHLILLADDTASLLPSSAASDVVDVVDDDGVDGSSDDDNVAAGGGVIVAGSTSGDARFSSKTNDALTVCPRVRRRPIFGDCIRLFFREDAAHTDSIVECS